MFKKSSIVSVAKGLSRKFDFQTSQSLPNGININESNTKCEPKSNNYLYKLLFLIRIRSSSADSTILGKCEVFFLCALYVLSLVDYFTALAFSAIHVQRLKLVLVNSTCYILSILTWCTLRWKRKQLSALFRKFEKHNLSPDSKKINAFVCLTFFSFLLKMSLAIYRAFRIEHIVQGVFGLGLKSTFLKIAIHLTRSLLRSFIYSTLVNLIMLLYLSMCHRCAQELNSLTEDIRKCPPEFFTTEKQVDTLRQEAVVEDILHDIQDTFSATSFFVFVSHFSYCSGMIAVLLFDQDSVIMDTVILLFLLAVSLFCAIACLWWAGAVPIAIASFKQEFSKKTQMRMIGLGLVDDPRYERQLHERKNIVLTGCTVFHFTRNSILAALGTLLTYTILLLNYKY